ncbi:hypothetical protein Bca101_019337 [Brassica carinata]
MVFSEQISTSNQRFSSSEGSLKTPLTDLPNDVCVRMKKKISRPERTKNGDEEQISSNHKMGCIKKVGSIFELRMREKMSTLDHVLMVSVLSERMESNIFYGQSF